MVASLTLPALCVLHAGDRIGTVGVSVVRSKGHKMKSPGVDFVKVVTRAVQMCQQGVARHAITVKTKPQGWLGALVIIFLSVVDLSAFAMRV